MPPAELTITLADRDGRVSVATLTKALAAAIKTLRSLEEEENPSGANIRWEVIRASKNSPLSITIGAHPNGVATRKMSRKVVSEYVRGIQQMERNPILPPNFTEEAAVAVQDMVSAAQNEGTTLTLSSGKTRIASPTPRIVNNITQIVSKSRKYVDYGTIEGVLEEVSIHGGGNKIGVLDSFTNQFIPCNVTPEQMKEAMRYFGKRVAVSGSIRYSRHKPTSLTIEDPIRLLRDVNELPQIETMPPINITGELRSEEYVRSMRDAQ